MDPVTLTAQRREDAGRSSAQAARRRGNIPAVVYGHGQDPAAIEVSAREFTRVLREGGQGALVTFALGGNDSTVAMVKEVQHKPMTREVVHIDFLRVAMDEAVDMAVPLEFEGEAAGVRHGGVVEHPLFELAVRCSPRNKPGAISVDVTGLGVGERLTAGQIALPEGVELLTPADDTVVACLEPSRAEEAAPSEPQAIQGAPAEGEDQAKKAAE